MDARWWAQRPLAAGVLKETIQRGNDEAMKTRQLGKDGPFVPIICLGAWPLSGGMGACPEDQAIRTVHASLDAGITFIDTAEAYFTSETVLGKALRGHRHEVFLATKLSGEHSSQHIAEAIENSLRELNTDYVDLYQVHGPRPQYPIADTMADLLKLKDDGKIRYIGVSNFSAQQHVDAAQCGPLHSSQPQYHMLYRKAEEDILPACLEIGIGVIVHSPLARGLLTGKYLPGHRFPGSDKRSGYEIFGSARFDSAYSYVEKLSAWAADRGRDIVQLAIAWTLGPPRRHFQHRRRKDPRTGPAQRLRCGVDADRVRDRGA